MPVPSDWDRVAADPALLAALRRGYAGSGDPLDHLWWAEHPGDPTPDGVEDPAAALERARHGLYRPGAGAQDAGRLREADAALAADRDAAVEALRSADAERLRRRRPEQRNGAPGRSRRLLAAWAVAALVVGAASGYVGGRFVRPEAPALRVFDRPQREADRPPPTAPLPSGIRRSTLREVGSAATSGTVVYAAKARDGRICAIAVVLAADYVATCSSPTAFAEAGLTLAYEAIVDPTDDLGLSTTQRIALTWSPDGPVRF